MIEPPLYVYQLKDVDGAVVYVGKGSGYRLRTQVRRSGLVGEIVKRFSDEKAAYRFEKKLIAKLRPFMNKCTGGGGGKYGRMSCYTVMDKIGTRAYAARLLLNVAKVAPHLVDMSKLEQPREVAYGGQRAA